MKFDVIYLVHLSVPFRVDADDEEEAQEVAALQFEGWASDHDVVNENLADAEVIETHKVVTNTPGEVALALAWYKQAVEHNGTRDAVMREINSHPTGGDCLYEVQEHAAEPTEHENPIVLDYDAPVVINAVVTGLKAMVASWELEEAYVYMEEVAES